MSDRNPKDEKRRAIEGLLGRHKQSQDTTADTRDQQPQQENPQDDDHQSMEELEYSPVDFSGDEPPEDMDNTPEDGADPAPSRSNGMGNAIIVASAILVIAVIASVLIIIRDDIVDFFTVNPDSGNSNREQERRIEELEDQLNEKQAAGDNTLNEDSLNRLRAANQDLDALLTEEQSRNVALKQRIDELETQIQQASAGDTTSASDTDSLQAQLNSARSAIDQKDTAIRQLQRDKDKLDETISTLSRENARLNTRLNRQNSAMQTVDELQQRYDELKQERDTLAKRLRDTQSQLAMQRSMNRNSGTTDEQLQAVNDEYRRVLQLLQESREETDEKQTRISRLMRENSQLRSQVNRLESQLSTMRQPQHVSNSTTNTTGSPANAEPQATKIVRPEYPDSALRRGVSGTVVLQVRIGTDGRVIETKVVSSPDPMKALDRAAVRAMMQWRFSPAIVDGSPIETWHRVPLEFTLSR